MPMAFRPISPDRPSGDTAAAAKVGSSHCPVFTPAVDRQTSRRVWALRILLPIAALATLAALFVGTQVLERHLLPDISTGWQHALLTLRAAVVTVACSAAVFFPMQRRRRRLTRTAEQLRRLLESYDTDHSMPARFENPYLVHCEEALRSVPGRRAKDVTSGERCWHVVALNNRNDGVSGPAVSIQRCLGCDVYRRSCPDDLAELGESFNNMMFLLENEARQVGRMRTEMIEKEKMVAIGQMASGVAHEVGNPLSSISSIVQMLKRKKDQSPDTDQLDLIQTHIQRISTTVRQLVSLARPGTEHWERIDIAQTLEETVRLVSFDRRARNVEIACDASAALRPTFGLRTQLQQVFINLALNALDAMPGAGRLTIDARMRRGGVEVTIEDTGSGIPTDVGRRIFEPFFTTKEVGHGTGLGLSVSYGIIQKHGGTIDYCPAPDEGTVFTVFLPTLERTPKDSHGSKNNSAR